MTRLQKNLINTMLAEDFWTFSCLLYDKEGVAKACLALQDNHQCNVNLLLFCVFLTKRNQGMSEALLTDCLNSIKDCEDALSLHRQKRRAAKSDAQNYEILKQQELELEKQQQQLLLNTYCKQISNEDIHNPIKVFCSHYNLAPQTIKHTLAIVEANAL